MWLACKAIIQEEEEEGEPGVQGHPRLRELDTSLDFESATSTNKH